MPFQKKENVYIYIYIHIYAYIYIYVCIYTNVLLSSIYIISIYFISSIYIYIYTVYTGKYAYILFRYQQSLVRYSTIVLTTLLGNMLCCRLLLFLQFYLRRIRSYITLQLTKVSGYVAEWPDLLRATIVLMPKSLTRINHVLRLQCAMSARSTRCYSLEWTKTLYLHAVKNATCCGPTWMPTAFAWSASAGICQLQLESRLPHVTSLASRAADSTVLY